MAKSPGEELVVVGHHSDQDGATPMTTPRRCTDAIWIIIFLAALGGFGATFYYAVARGSFKRISGLPDYQGRTCGQDGRGNFVYYCESSTSASSSSNFLSFSLTTNVCVDQCPTAEMIQTQDLSICKNLALGDDQYLLNRRGPGRMLQAGVLTSDLYPSTPFAGILCLPKDPQLLKKVYEIIKQNPFLKYMLRVESLAKEWQLMAISAGFGFTFALIYLIFVRFCGRLILFLSSLLFILSLAGEGTWLLMMSGLTTNQQWAINAQSWLVLNAHLTTAQLSQLNNNSLGSASYDQTVGIVLIVTSVLISLLILCECSNISKAVGCVEEACKCLLEIPLILLEPVVAILLKIAVIIPLSIGFIALIVSGNIAQKVDTGLLTNPQASIQKNWLDWTVLVYYSIVAIWLLELLHCFSEFVLCYVVEQWYFDRRSGTLAMMFRAQIAALRYHMGSLIFGSFLTTIFKALQIIAMIIERVGQMTENPVGRCVGMACLFVTSCLDRCLRWISRNAFMDMALNSTGYCAGARHAVQLIASHTAEVAALHGATFLFQLTGLGGITAATGLGTYLLATKVPQFNTPSSGTYVEDPLVLGIASLGIGFLMALPVVHMLGLISDTILYCRAVEETRNAEAGYDKSNGAYCVDTQCWGCYSKKDDIKASVAEKKPLLFSKP